MPQVSPQAAEAKRAFYARLEGLKAEEAVIDPGVRVLDYGPGETIFRRNAPVTNLYFLLGGRVQERGLRRLPNGVIQRRLVRQVQPHPQQPIRPLGLYDFLYHQPYSTHAWADTLCQLLVIDVQTFEKLIYHQPQLPGLLAPLTLIDRLRTIPALRAVERTELSYLAEACDVRTVKPPAPLTLAASSIHRFLYIIDHGQVEVLHRDGTRTLLANGTVVGLHEDERQAQVYAPAQLFQVEQETLLALTPLNLVASTRRQQQAVQRTLEHLPLLSDPAFTPAIRTRLAGYMSHYALPHNTLIAQQGAMSDSLWVLMSGQPARLHALDDDGHALSTTMVQGPLAFCEGALLAQTVFEATLEAPEGSQWLRLHRADFQAFLREGGTALASKLHLRQEVQLQVGQRPATEQYPWLQDGEGIIWPSRRHWFVLLRKLWLAALLFVLMLLTGGVEALLRPPLAGWPSLTGLLALFTLGLLAWNVYDYWNDYIVVTNRRIVREEHRLLQSRRLQETGLEQIRNVDFAKSFWGQLLDYGLLKVQTAGSQGTIAFDFIPQVERVQRIIINQMARRRHYREAASKLEIQKQLEGRLGLRVELPERVRPWQPPESLVVRSGQRLLRRLLPRRLSRTERYAQERLVWRKHWIILVLRVLWPTLLLSAICAVLLAEMATGLGVLFGIALAPLTLLLVMAALFLVGLIAWRYADWRNDTYEVTRDEFADVEKKPLFFDEQRRTARLVDIDNIRTEIPSTFHYLLNYGNVLIETAATQGNFTFDGVPDPNGVATEVRRRIEEARRRDELERARARARELTDWFELYNRLESGQGT
jgi:CRP-like cAMP-binding protein/uncharacterized membrane protein YdbT with pleckstrin-like domain